MIPEIITPMNFTLVRDFICNNLRDVRENQKELAKKGGATDEWINETIHFTIFPKRFRFPNVEEMPCVFVYFDEATYPTDEQDVYENEATANLVVEYYATGLNGNDENRTADSNAEDRLNYLTAQLYKILCSDATNIYVATNRIVKRFTIKSWKRTATPELDNTAATVLGARFEFNVGFAEPTHYANTTEIIEFYTKANIREEFIDPYVRHIVTTKGE